MFSRVDVDVEARCLCNGMQCKWAGLLCRNSASKRGGIDREGR